MLGSIGGLPRISCGGGLPRIFYRGGLLPISSAGILLFLSPRFSALVRKPTKMDKVGAFQLLRSQMLRRHIFLHILFRCIFHKRFTSFPYTIKFEHTGIKLRRNNISSTNYPTWVFSTYCILNNNVLFFLLLMTN